MNIPPLISRSPPPLDDDNNDEEDDEDEFTNMDPLDGVILDRDTTKPDCVYINSKHIASSENVEGSNDVFESQLLKKCDHANPPKDNLHSDNSINHFSEESKSSVIKDASDLASACTEDNEFSDWFSESNFKSHHSLVNAEANELSANQCKNGSFDSINSSNSAPSASETDPQNLPTVINLKDVPQCTDDAKIDSEANSNSKECPPEIDGHPTSVEYDSEDIICEPSTSPEVEEDNAVSSEFVTSTNYLTPQVSSPKDNLPDSSNDIQCLSPEWTSGFSDVKGDASDSKGEQANVIEEITDCTVSKLSDKLFEETECDSQLNTEGSFPNKDSEIILPEDDNYCKIASVDDDLKNDDEKQVIPESESDNDSFDDFVSFHPAVPVAVENIPSSAHPVPEASTSFGSYDPAPSEDFGDFSQGFDDFTDFASFDAAPVTIASSSKAPSSQKLETLFSAPEELSSDVSTKDLLPMCLTEVLKSNIIWLGLSNCDSTPALTFKWTASVANRKLLGALRIDSRNILAAPWNRSVPIKGSSSDDVKYSGSESENSANVLGSKAAVPQPHFDWVGSGLVNPLDVNQKAQCLQAKGSAVSFKATSFLQSLPDLSYMHQRCIVFPKKV